MSLKSKLLFAAGAAAGLTYLASRRTDNYSFRDKVVLITGGSRGLGLVIARQLASEGAHLAILARDEEEIRRGQLDIAARGAEVFAFPADVTNQEEVEHAIQRVVDHYGRIDVLINNAGVIQVGPMEHMTVKDYQNAMAVHFFGPLYAILATLPVMRSQRAGRIINISSIGGKIAVPHLLPYCASKFALTGLSNGMRTELAKDNITVTTVCPGLMRTGSPINAFVKGQFAKEYAWFAISDGLPGTSIAAERAASQILDASRTGRAEIIVTLPAKLAAIGSSLLPEMSARILERINRILPNPTPTRATRQQTGRQSSAGILGALTHINSPAATRNNEV